MHGSAKLMRELQNLLPGIDIVAHGRALRKLRLKTQLFMAGFYAVLDALLYQGRLLYCNDQADAPRVAYHGLRIWKLHEDQGAILRVQPQAKQECARRP
jgi:hypothetical protein